LQDIADLKAQRDKGVISLNEAERRKEATALEKRFKDRAQAGDGEDLGDDGLEAGERSLSADIAITGLAEARRIGKSRQADIRSQAVQMR
ncbi:tail-specific protease, partial [Rhizobium ruizarguesonis]